MADPPEQPEPTARDSPGATGFMSLGSEYVPPAVDELQQVLPHLEILQLIGHGGMGTFYQARQSKLDRLVALKVLPVDPDSDARLIAGFKREARTMAGLSHPGIISIYDFGETDSVLFLVMEFVHGDILERLIPEREFDLTQIINLVSQICDALHYAHEQGVVHRDIRPGNTLLDDQGRVKVGDFGLARLVGEELFRRNLTMENRAMGTLDYVAPEQFETEARVDHRADVYSVGMILYKLLTHTLPHGGFVPPTELVPELDPRIDEVVIRALQRDPDNRYQGVAELWAEVQALVTEDPSGPRKPKFHFPD